MLKTIPIPYVTSLEQLREEFNDTLHSFVTFRVQKDHEIVSNATIPWCRFRDYDNLDVWEVRSCDCSGLVCGHPTQRLHLSKSQVKNYIFNEQINSNYIFVYQI
jgi:hypothetical protein